MTGFKEAAKALREAAPEIKVFAGLDGTVDEIIHIVEKRTGAHVEDYQRFEKIADFGEKIVQASGLSSNFEMVPVLVKIGGNGPIYVNALLELGLRVTYCGSLGYPDIHPVFKSMADNPRCEIISRWQPSHTDAFEFQDGKIIMGKLRVFYDITWESFKEAMGGVHPIAKHLESSQLVGLLNWTMLPFMSRIWEGVLEEVLPLVNFDGKTERPFIFFDLADPAKRSLEDIKQALGLIARLNKSFRAVLGLNEKESRQIAAALGVQNPENLEYKELAEAVYERLDLHCVVIHPTTCAFAMTKDGYFHAEGPYCEKPVLTTGAGDNFNAGFCIGLLRGLDPGGALKTGVAMSGFYVRKGRSATLSELADFMDSIG